MVWTKYIFPSIRIILWLAIAMALVTLAFGSKAADNAETDEEFPSSDFSGGAHQIERADITSTLDLTATVVVDPSVEVRAGAVGTAGYWAVTDGETVIKGQALLDIHMPIMSKPTVDEEGNITEPYDTGYFNRHTLYAPITGKIQRTVDLKEETTKTTPVFSVTPGTLSIEGSLTPQEQFKILELPSTAKVTLTGGPEPFTCQKLALGTDVVTLPDPSDENADPMENPVEETPGQSVGVKLRCPAPPDIRLIAGLDGTMSILAGEVKDAVVVPVTALQFVKDTGRVWVIDAQTGEETERDVVLGLTQGPLIEVIKGLKPGETVREFAPGNMDEMFSDEFQMGF